MTGTGETSAAERERLIRIASELIEQRGDDVTRGAVAAAAGVPRTRVEALFPEDIDLFDARATAPIRPRSRFTANSAPRTSSGSRAMSTSPTITCAN